MKTLFAVGALLATIPPPPAMPPAEQIDVGAKPFVEFVGLGDAKVQIRHEEAEGFLGIAASYPEGSGVGFSFQRRRFGGMWIEARDGENLSVLFDNDGDGLPEVRHVYLITKSGDREILKIEVLDWTVRESTKMNLEPKQNE
jgi:hypothetical protein